MTDSNLDRQPRRGRWIWRIVAVSLGLVFALLLALTDAAPGTEERSVPTAQQAGAGRDAALRIRRGVVGSELPQPVQLENVHLDGLSALASHGLRPNRLDMSVRDGVFSLKGSHQLPLGRWLNMTAEVEGSSKGFPEASSRIGSIPLSPTMTRMVANVGRWGIGLTGAEIPPLDELVLDVEVREDDLLVTLDLPTGTGFVDQLLGGQNGVDASLVSDIFCSLAEQQAADPRNDFAVHVHRAFPKERSGEATPASNKAAFVALAMAVVDKRVGVLAGVSEAKVADCAMPPRAIFLHNRWDLPKHWALSAALEASTGSQLAEAMGEWKELADTLPGQSPFQVGAGSGFSFIDIAADRSGFRTAEKAGSASQAQTMAARLSRVTQEEILPKSLLTLREGRGVDFSDEFGSIEDERYRKAIEAIDAVLDENGLVRTAP